MIFYGRNVSIEALRSDLKVRSLFVDTNINKEQEKIETLLELAHSKNIPIQYTSRKALDKKAESDDHQGVLIDVDYTYSNLDKNTLEDAYDSSLARFIYISEAHHDYNIGAIIRSAEVSGAKGVIIPKEASINAVSAKASTGSLFHIPVFQESIFNSIKKFSTSGYPIFGIERDGTPYYEENIEGPALFIIGGENKSLSESVRSKCNSILEIPQKGKVNSLNMSVAASIILFEGLKKEITSSNQ